MSSNARSKNLSASDIEKIVGIIDGWDDEKLTWGTLILELDRRMARKYARQTLFKREPIRHAFDLAKKRLGLPQGCSQRTVSREMQILLDQNARLKAENERIKAVNKKLMEQFIVWGKNAQDRGLTLEILNRPLYTVNRGQTKRNT